MSGCNLPPALLAESPGSFMCHCCNKGVERTPNKSQHAKLTLEKKLATFRSQVRHSYPQAILPPLLTTVSIKASQICQPLCSTTTMNVETANSKFRPCVLLEVLQLIQDIKNFSQGRPECIGWYHLLWLPWRHHRFHNHLLYVADWRANILKQCSTAILITSQIPQPTAV